MGGEHPGLYRKVLKVKPEELHWVRPDLALKVGEEGRYDLLIRYRQPLQGATVYQRPNGLLAVFAIPNRGITAGRLAARNGNEDLPAREEIIIKPAFWSAGTCS